MGNKARGLQEAQAGMALMSGDSHLGIANRYIQSIPFDASTVVKYSHKNIGGLFAASVNLTLSIELYLKSYLIRHDIKFEHKHDLMYLFNLLPEQIKEKVKDEYKFYKPHSENPFNKLSSVYLCGGGSSSKAKNHDIESVLRRSKDAFESHRYLFDNFSESSSQSLLFEYGALWCIARAIRKQLSGAIVMNGQEMVLAFPFIKMPQEVKSLHVVSDGVFNTEPFTD